MSDRRDDILDYLDGEMDEARQAELHDWLNESAEHWDQLAALSFIHSAIGEQLRKEESAALFRIDALHDLPEPEKNENDVTMKDVSSALRYVLRHTFTPKRLAAIGSVAALFVIAVMLFFVLQGESNEPAPNLANTPKPENPEPFNAPAQSVATLTATHNAKWRAGRDTVQPSIDDGLRSGDRLTLVTGFAEITTNDGAIAILEAPATIELLDHNNALRLYTGKLVGICETQSSKGFVVKTDHATLIDIGTEFGVEVSAENGTFAQVYRGQVTLAAVRAGVEIGTPLLLGSDQAARVEVGGQSMQSADIQEQRFVRHEVLDALNGERGQQAQAQAIQEIRDRDSAVLAVQRFDNGEDGLGQGIASKQNAGLRHNIADQSLALSGEPGAVLGGGRLLFINPSKSSTVFYNLDLSEGGPFDRAGLLEPGGKRIGADGKRVCLSWVSNLEQSEITPEGWFVLSLFTEGKRRIEDVVLALGKNHQSLSWGAKHKNSPDKLSQAAPLTDVDGKPIEIKEGEPCRWLVVIDFGEQQADQVSIYLNPDPSGPMTPSLRFEGLDLAFSLIRIESGETGCAWSVDDLLVGTTIDSVLRD